MSILNDSGNKKFLLVGDSYGLPRFHNDEFGVSQEQCWPFMLKEKMELAGCIVELFFRQGLLLKDCESFIHERAKNGFVIVYCGGIVDFFPRTLPQSLALSTKPIIMMLRKFTFRFRRVLHGLGFTYTWGSLQEYKRFFSSLPISSRGFLLGIPPLIAYQILNNPNSQNKLSNISAEIEAFSKDNSWRFISLDFMRDRPDIYFHPKDGHFSSQGNIAVFEKVLSEIMSVYDSKFINHLSSHNNA